MAFISSKFPIARIAVSMLFFGNGLFIGVWTPMIPVFKARLLLSESELGLVILALGLGALVAMPIGGALIARYGTRLPIIFNSLLCAPGLVLVTLAPDMVSAVIVLTFFGMFWAGMDVAMNSNVIEVERQTKRAIMSSCHGFWSVGGLVGALFGGKTLFLLGETGHALFWMVIFLLLMSYALRKMENEPPSEEQVSAGLKIRFPRSILPYMLGIICLLAIVPEGVVIDWSGLLLHEERGFELTTAGYGFAAFSLSMAFVRFTGDYFRQKYGAVNTLRVCLVFSITGFTIVTLSSQPTLTILGFFITGIGISNLFPIAVSAAGNLPGIPSGVSVSMVTSVGYSGFLLAPPLFGFVAQAYSYTFIFALMPLCLFIIFFAMYPVRYADEGTK
jgi:fucose permease